MAVAYQYGHYRNELARPICVSLCSYKAIRQYECILHVLARTCLTDCCDERLLKSFIRESNKNTGFSYATVANH